MILNLPLLLVKDTITCFLAAAFFALLISAPKKSIPISSALASVGYVIYDIVFIGFGKEIAAYFVGTLLIAIVGEILARVLKMPSTVFVVPAIVPLVPGVGIYKTMLHLVEDDFSAAAQRGATTLFCAAAMAVAIAVGNLIVQQLSRTVAPVQKKHTGAEN